MDWVEVAKDAVVADATVCAHGAWALVLIEGNDAEDELELAGTLSVGADAGVGMVLLEGAAPAELNGDGGAVGVAVPTGGV